MHIITQIESEGRKKKNNKNTKKNTNTKKPITLKNEKYQEQSIIIR